MWPLPIFWFALVLVGSSLFLLMPTLWGLEIYRHYRGVRAVTCPETHAQVAVSLNALHAATARLRGVKDLRIEACTHWPERSNCDQQCLPEAVRTAPYTQGEIAARETKPIYHLPVLIAAAVAWLLGVAWHSEFLLRRQWSEALGLSPLQIRQMLWWWSPHLLSIAVPLLFAYGVAGLVAINRSTGVGKAISASLLLWFAVSLSAFAGGGVARFSPGWIWTEALYTLLASVAIGAVIGTLNGRLVMSALEGNQGRGGMRRRIAREAL